MARVNPVRVGHPRSLLAGGLGVFASLLAVGWALFGYNLSSTVNFASGQSENLMLLQFSVAFIVLIGSGLMLARYTRLGGAINILGGVATFGIGVLYARVLENQPELRVCKLSPFASLRSTLRPWSYQLTVWSQL